MLTSQEVFDKAVIGCLTQGVCSKTRLGCAYRGDGGTKCAAGFLIDDEHYHPSFEGGFCNRLDVSNALYQSGVDVGLDMSLVRDLQEIHDRCDPKDWPARFYSIAQRHDVNTLVISAFERGEYGNREPFKPEPSFVEGGV